MYSSKQTYSLVIVSLFFLSVLLLDLRNPTGMITAESACNKNMICDPHETINSCFTDCATIQKQVKRFDLGFSLAFLSDHRMARSSVEQIRRDGFTKLRFSDPFTKGFNPDTTRMRDDYHAHLIPHLRNLSRDGFDVVLSISNFPYQFLPSQEKIDANNLTKNALRYSNKYPPNDMLSYKEYMKLFINDLADAIGMEKLERWYFDIGNEPDAPLFYGGTLEEYNQLIDTLVAGIREVNPNLNVGAGSFTSSLPANKIESDRSIAYRAYAKQLQNKPLNFFSYHLYNGVFTNNNLPPYTTPSTEQVLAFLLGR